MRLNLLTKFTLVIWSALLLAMVIFALVNVHALKKVFVGEAVKDIDNLSQTIIQTTHYQMLENNRDRVYQMIQEVGTQKGVEHIRLINKDGRIIFSTDKAEVGKALDKQAAACTMCHTRRKPLTQVSSMSRSRIFRDTTGKEVLGIAKGIYSDPSCVAAACHFHGPKAKLLGVLDVIVSLEDMNARMASYRNGIIGLTVAMLAILLLCLAALTRRVIHRPVDLLLDHTRRLSRGELDSRIENPSRDELGELADGFNLMATSLQKTRRELKECALSLEARVEERTDEIRKMQSELLQSEKLAALGEMSSGIAHEINNPLTGILLFASMLHDDPRLDPALKKDLATILGETRRCAEIVRGLLEFSRKSPPCKSMHSINYLMDKTLSLVEHQAFFFNIQVSRRYEVLLPDLLIDPNQIEQVFMNILLNAAQAMPQGGSLNIETGLRSADSSVYARITDTGCGIPADHVEKIFDPFFTTKGAQGTGLGLSVSYGIVENHGGQIEVESQVGQGTSFVIKFPLSSSNEASSADGGTSIDPA